jgi:hypothetical protein
MAIPAKLEELILEGKARFETYQAGYTEFNVIPVQSKEFIVITGFQFQPASRVVYTGSGISYSVIQRVEFFDGNNYNHFIAKMGGGAGGADVSQNSYDYENLYCVFHNDIGVMVTVPVFGPIDLSSFRDTIDGSNGNTARKVINQGTNPYLTTAQSVQYATESASAGTFNVPGNRGINDPNYTNSMATGPHGIGSQETNQFQFTSEPNPVFYNTAASYAALEADDLRKSWYLNIQYVRVFNSGSNVR